MVLVTMTARPDVKEKLSCISKDTYNILIEVVADENANSYTAAVIAGHPINLSGYVASIANIMADVVLDIKIY